MSKTQFTQKQWDVIKDAVMRVNIPWFRFAAFVTWLVNNKPVWDEFEKRALALRKEGFDRWGARHIAEEMRLRSAVRDCDGQYKINNVWVPDMARLVMALHPVKMKNFFTLRHRFDRVQSNHHQW